MSSKVVTDKRNAFKVYFYGPTAAILLPSRFLGKEGEKVEGLTLKVLHVRLEDDPYKTIVKENIPYFYVRQVLTLEDPIGNLVTFRISAHAASRESCQLPDTAHAFQPGETVNVASARIARTYTSGNKQYTRLNYVKIKGG